MPRAIAVLRHGIAQGSLGAVDDERT